MCGTATPPPHTEPSWWSTAEAPGWTADEAKRRLTAAGWTVGQTRAMPDGLQAGPGARPATPITRTAFDATRDGLHLRVFGGVTPDHRVVECFLRAQGNASRWPLTVTGALIGLLTGWAPAAALAY